MSFMSVQRTMINLIQKIIIHILIFQEKSDAMTFKNIFK